MNKHNQSKHLSYEGYWIAYLQAHSKKSTRICHYFAAMIGVTLPIIGIMTLNAWLIILSIIIGYGVAIASHLLFQNNKPLIHNPLWGIRSAFRMFRFAITGKLLKEMQDRGVS